MVRAESCLVCMVRVARHGVGQVCARQVCAVPVVDCHLVYQGAAHTRCGAACAAPKSLRSLARGRLSAVCVFVCAAAARSASAESFGLPAFAFARLWRQSQRLGCGKKGIDELKAHAFFKSVAPCRFLPSIFLDSSAYAAVRRVPASTCEYSSSTCEYLRVPASTRERCEHAWVPLQEGSMGPCLE